VKDANTRPVSNAPIDLSSRIGQARHSRATINASRMNKRHNRIKKRKPEPAMTDPWLAGSGMQTAF